MDNPYAQSSGLIDRVKAIILKPAETWPAIAAEPATPGDLITRYALPLLIIGPIAGFIGGQVFGINAIVATYHPELMSGLTIAVLGVVMALISVIVISLVADFLADKFGGTADRTSAFKLVVYAMTPGWVAGALQIIPALGMLGLLAGLYGLYLFYLGATPVMKVPQDKAAGYTAVTTIAAIVLMWVASTATMSVAGLFGMGAAGMMSAASDDTVEMNIPGMGKIDTAKIEQASKQLEAAASGNVKAVDPAQLQALLPAALGSYARTAVETNAAGAMGTQAEGTYKNGDKTIRLTIIDSSGLGALAGMGAAFGAQHSREDADGYERAATVDGQMRIEEWNNKNNRGKFTQQFGGRFIISADGEAGSIDDLKGAVAGIDQGKLAGLAQ
jgi:hypothetical protein